MRPLSGLRVIDLTDDSGRFATKLLTEFGADVVRITNEGPLGGHEGCGWRRTRLVVRQGQR